MVRVRVVLVVLAVLTASSAWAQTGSAEGVGGRVFGWGDWQQMAAMDTFDAITGSSSVAGAGGGVEVHRLWRRVFARVSASRLRADGERVFVFDGEVFRLGIPLEVSMTPIEVGAGWRFRPIAERLTPYAGAGVMWLKYRESSPGDSSSERVNESWTGATLFGGVDVAVWRFVSAGAEVGWRTVKIDGPGGAMGAFGEDDLGGISVRVLVSIGR